jgi:acetyl esterase/lipase
VSLDPRVARFLGLLAASNPPNARDATVAARRAGLAELMKFSGPTVPIGRVENTTVSGPAGPVPVRLYTPAAQPPGAAQATGAARPPQAPEPDRLPGLVYFHGGGMVAGSLDTHDAIARALANAAACRVISVGYRLAPEHRFPAALDDAIAAVRHIRAHARDFGVGQQLGLAGDSAGATLVAAACQFLAKQGDTPLSLQLLLCPILDYSRTTPSRLEFGSGYLVDQGTLDHDLLHYLPAGTDPADPRVSPLLGENLAGLPRTFIHTAACDPLRDEGAHYAERLRASGTPTSYVCHAGMIHLFYGLAGVIPYARTALNAIGAELRAALS